MSQTAALLPDPGPGLRTVDGSVHGPGCYRDDGTVQCDWPERHDESFAAIAPSPEIALATRPGRWSSLAGRLLTALMVAGGVAALAIGILLFTGRIHLQTVVSGSMRPTISPGDVAITQAVAIDSLQLGDVIAFYPPGQTLPVLHRITSLEATPSGEVITTRGDANNVGDPWHATLKGTTAYRLVAVLPFIGWLSQLQRPVLILAAFLVGLAVLLELRRRVGEVKTNQV